jgi:metal-dependent amidase/aminoacylase/carboxypeptidase family protein
VLIKHGYPVLHNHEQLTYESVRLAGDLLGEAHVEALGLRMTAEDFAWFAREIPGMMYRLGVGDPGGEKPHPLHSPRFAAHESALRTGISLMSFLTVELLKIKPVEK